MCLVYGISWQIFCILQLNVFCLKYQFKRSPSLFSSIKSVLVTERSQSRVVLLQIGFFSFRFLISTLKASVCRGLSSLPWHKIIILCLYVSCLRHFLAHFLYPFILITMFRLFGFLVGFRGVNLSRFFEWDPVWRSEQRPELFEIGQDLTSEAVDGFAFEDVDIIASIVWFDNSRKWK